MCTFISINLLLLFVDQVPIVSGEVVYIVSDFMLLHPDRLTLLENFSILCLGCEFLLFC